MSVNLMVPKDAKGTYFFDVVRVSGQQILGGVTCQIEVTQPE
jgi:hypothetical protein